MPNNKTIVINISKLYQVRNEAKTPLQKGNDMATLPYLERAWLSFEGDSITGYGTEDTKPSLDAFHKVIDANGGIVCPSFIDCHTHIVFAGTRSAEFVARIKGKTYQQIAEGGGGILNSALQLGNMPEDTLYKQAEMRLQEVIMQGTGAIEIKSGYGLTLASELKMLRVIARLKANYPQIIIKATFLGAHAIPRTMPDKATYVTHIIEDMIPAVAAANLANYIDVFCDTGYFSPNDTLRILAAGKRFGLKGRIHANELAVSGGVQAGIAAGALSVDHLEEISDTEVVALKDATTLPVLLPGTAFFLKIPYAPARSLIDAGIGVVLASDYNPGSTPSGKMHFVGSLACLYLKMLPEEVINATTINAAHALEIEDSLGSITIGKKASFYITKPMTDIADTFYYFGSNNISSVYLSGQQQEFIQ